MNNFLEKKPPIRSDELKVPSQHIISAWKWYSWRGLDKYKDRERKNEFLNSWTFFYFSFSSPSGIVKHDRRCMQFADSANKFACGARLCTRKEFQSSGDVWVEVLLWMCNSGDSFLPVYTTVVNKKTTCPILLLHPLCQYCTLSHVSTDCIHTQIQQQIPVISWEKSPTEMDMKGGKRTVWSRDI
jgi:hypothetical protein